MAKQWTHIRIEKHLHQRLTALAATMMQAHVEGRISLPSDQVEHCTLAYVITKALDELDGHKSRARQQSSRKTRAARIVAQAEGMLTPVSPDQETRS